MWHRILRSGCLKSRIRRLSILEQSPGSERTQVDISTLGPDAKALGAAVLVCHAMFSISELPSRTTAST